MPAPTSSTPAPIAAAKAAVPLTVSALAGLIDHSLRAGVPAKVRVLGEVSGFRERTHWYFDLKDASAVVNAVMFQTAARKAGFTPANGQEIVASGRVEFYAKQGKVSFILDSIEPVGAGALDLAYRKLCEELRQLGWFDPARKRPLPAFPRRVAVITSRSAAALQDVLVTMERRCPAVGVVLVDVRVQGDGAAEEITKAVRLVGKRHQRLGIDAVLVTRGGGSMEDLWAFNDQALARAIVECPIPVVAAIGHETDTTIAELVADERCATPTQAAMRLTPDSAGLLRQLDSLAQRIRFVTVRQCRSFAERIARAAATPTIRDPRNAVRPHAQRAEALSERLRTLIPVRLHRLRADAERLGARLERQRPGAVHARTLAALDAREFRLTSAVRARLTAADVARVERPLQRAATQRLLTLARGLDGTERQLRAVGPLSVLERGFSVTLREDGRAVRAPSDVGPGERITTRLADGSIDSRVLGSPDESPAAPPVEALPPARTPSARPPPAPRNRTEQPGLFGS